MDLRNGALAGGVSLAAGSLIGKQSPLTRSSGGSQTVVAKLLRNLRDPRRLTPAAIAPVVCRNGAEVHLRRLPTIEVQQSASSAVTNNRDSSTISVDRIPAPDAPDLQAAPLSAMPEPTTDEHDRRTKLLRDEVEVVAASLNFSAKFGNRDVGYSMKLRVLAQPPQKRRAGNV
jgi:hypothetical protein